MQMLLPGLDEVSQSLAAKSSLHFVTQSKSNSTEILSISVARPSLEPRDRGEPTSAQPHIARL